MISIDARYNGPPASAHGGVAAGRIAELVDPRRAVVRLHAPIPLGTPMTVLDRTGDALAVGAGGTVATVRPLASGLDLDGFPRPERALVGAAEEHWLDAAGGVHPFPTCFGCGPDRAGRDGLGLRPGRVDGLDVHATTWSPPGSGEVPAWLAWAALDCGSAGPAATAAEGAPVVTGELAVEIREPVPARVPHLLVSRLAERDGRKLSVEAALLGPAGRVFALARSTWFTIRP